MLDGLYQDIGKKIKSWAKWIFIVEAIGAVITGLSILLNGGEVVLALLTIVLGPCVALVSTWLLYAAGEAVDKLCDIERNTRGSRISVPDTSEDAAVADISIDETQDSSSDNPPADNSADTNAVKKTVKLAWEPESNEIYVLNLQAKVVPNFIFSKYDVDVHLDNKHVCTIFHGTKQSISIPVGPGEHSLTFSCSGDTDAKPNHQTIQIEEDTHAAYSIECFRNQVLIFKGLFDETEL